MQVNMNWQKTGVILNDLNEVIILELAPTLVFTLNMTLALSYKLV